MKRKGKLFVVSAPSGSGKTTLCERLLQELPAAKKPARSISVTTRSPRRGERHGREYFFVSRREFLKRRKAGRFLEWAKVLNNFYGTPRGFVEEHLNAGRDVLLSIDVQGAEKIKAKAKKAVFIFILPPSLSELEQRLKGRSTEGKSEINRRLQLAKQEMQHIGEYDYVVLNDTIDQALGRLKTIMEKETGK